ncbi:MAG: CooT family nickel-binding protein [Desulfuromonadales bacterium]|nr:CooT family nickel-binding protein [Desulfuromonadales bacterium]MDT8424324.1 CooT family nickel-binding protein [Desulfuromonadales bacterium]
MCMDQGAFVLLSGDEEIALENVASLLPTATGLKLVDLFGKTREVTGQLEEIDLLNRRIVLTA